MSNQWTPDQKKVIDLRNRNLLVSAAAGSGKTAVLIERILNLISDPVRPVDIDELLVVTFTRAAAGEMRERLNTAIEKKLSEGEEEEHLTRQLTLIQSAQITTIDSFCSYILKSYVHVIGLDPNYRVMDEGEGKLLKTQVVQELLESYFEEATPEFQEFVECLATGKNDQILEDSILRLYEFAMSYPYPEKWLEECLSVYSARTMEEFAGSESRKGPGYYPVETREKPAAEAASGLTAEEVHTDLGHQDVFEPSENEWETVSMGNEDEWNEPISGETDSEPIDGYYKTLESERGEAKGSFFVPEDSKTVVTASGKVIETDTEAI